MKKGLTILTAAFAVTTLIGCKGGSTPSPTPETSKITSVKVQAVPYALCNTLYKVSSTVEGEGKFSTEVAWSSTDPDVYISDGYFIYTDKTIVDYKEVEITATSVQDNTKKANATITVVPYEVLTCDEFLEKAASGDQNRKGLQMNDVTAEPGKDDFFINREGVSVPVTSAKYVITASGSPDVIALNTGIKRRTRVIPTSTQLQSLFEGKYKDHTTWFSFNETGRGECYGYYVFQPAEIAEEGKDLFIYCVFQADCGLPVYETYIEDETCYSYLNLTPQLQ